MEKVQVAKLTSVQIQEEPGRISCSFILPILKNLLCVLRPLKEAKKTLLLKIKKHENMALFYFELKTKVHFYLVSDLFSRAQTSESVESAKIGLSTSFSCTSLDSIQHY